MTKVKIYGAGSAGTHLAYASRQMDWDVCVVDPCEKARERQKLELFPKRYGAWDKAIRSSTPEQVRNEPFDIIIVATPPDSHLAIGLAELKAAQSRILLIEKPLCTPGDSLLAEFIEQAASSATRVLVGYNLNLVPATLKMVEWLNSRRVGDVIRIDVGFQESLEYIMGAHWWFESAAESYLSSIAAGGGALLEHSHAIALWLRLAAAAEAGQVIGVQGQAQERAIKGRKYDGATDLLLQTQSGILGLIQADFLSKPARKYAAILGTKGRIEWWANKKTGFDTVEFHADSEHEVIEIPKKRTDDFYPQVKYLSQILASTIPGKENDLSFGLEVMRIAELALISAGIWQVSPQNLKARHG